MPGWVQVVLTALGDRLPRPLAIAFDILPGETDYASAIRGAQLRAILRLTPVAIIASCLNAALFLATWAATAPLPPALLVWAVLILASAGNYIRNWLRSRRFTEERGASRRALRRAVLHASIFGLLWAFVPAYAFPGASPGLQLFIGCLAAGMM